MITRKTWCSTFTALAVVVACLMPQAKAALFTNIGGPGAQTWESAVNWTQPGGDTYPGQTLLVDDATLAVSLGAPMTISISTPIQVNILSIGDTNAVPSSTNIDGTGTLTATQINTIGAAGAVNVIDVDYLLKNSVTINSGGTNALTINGDIINNLPGVNAFKDVRNDSGQTLTINGNVVLSNAGSVNAGDVRFRQGGDTTTMFINGVISDGAVAGGQVNYARGIYHIVSANTYTGTTQLGENSPNNVSTNIIYTDSPFGTGQINSAGGNAIKTIEGAAGFGTRTLANEIRIAQGSSPSPQLGLRFAGTESIVLNGQIFQSASRGIINDISGVGKKLSINGNIFTDSGTNVADVGRKFTFQGSGVTEVSGVIEDKLLAPNLPVVTANRGNVRKTGAGRLIYLNSSVASYGQATEVYAGTLQLGTGGASVNLNSHSVQGTAVGGGTLEINHSGSMNFDASLGYNLVVNHTGSGTTTFSDNSFGSGTITASAGTVLIDGGLFASTVTTGFRDPAGTGNTASVQVAGGTAGLHIGQPVTGSPIMGTGTFPIDAYIAEITDANFILISANIPTVTGGLNDWNLTFGAGTGTGTADVLANGGTVGGNGIIGGNLNIAALGTLAPGSSIGTLSVLGDAVIAGGFDVEYNGTGTGSIDKLAVTGSLTIDPNATLDFSQVLGGAPANDFAYIFASYGSLSGTFTKANVTKPAGYYVNYAYQGNNIALVVPEPSTCALLLSCLAAIGMFRSGKE